jgi:glucokinase
MKNMVGLLHFLPGINYCLDIYKYESLYGSNVKKLLAQNLDIEEADIMMMNDASCFLQGEIFNGAAAGCNHIIGVTLGTGLGSARFHNNKMYDGDLYYTPFKDGTAEDYLSSRWFVKRYKEVTGNIVKDVKELSERMNYDPSVQIVFDEFGNNLGEVLSDYATKHEGKTIVAGGNIMNAWNLFIAKTKQHLANLPLPGILQKLSLARKAH